MGEILVKYYDYAGQKGGLLLQLKLAMTTHLAQPQAREAPDSPELKEKFQNALRTLLGDDPSIPRY